MTATACLTTTTSTLTTTTTVAATGTTEWWRMRRTAAVYAKGADMSTRAEGLRQQQRSDVWPRRRWGTAPDMNNYSPAAARCSGESK
jgi:hypothetical protein